MVKRAPSGPGWKRFLLAGGQRPLPPPPPPPSQTGRPATPPPGRCSSWGLRGARARDARQLGDSGARTRRSRFPQPARCASAAAGAAPEEPPPRTVLLARRGGGGGRALMSAALPPNPPRPRRHFGRVRTAGGCGGSGGRFPAATGGCGRRTPAPTGLRQRQELGTSVFFLGPRAADLPLLPFFIFFLFSSRPCDLRALLRMDRTEVKPLI